MTTTTETTTDDSDAHKHLGGIFGMVAGFLPWIAYWAMLGSVPFHTAVLVAFGIAAAVFLVGLRHGAKILELGTMTVFAALVVVTFLGSDAFLERWMQPLSNAGLFLVALTSVLVGKPFTLQYARDAVTPEVAAEPGFAYLNGVITWVWVAAFGVMTASSFIPPIVQGDATFRDGGSTLSIICYWVVPFTVLGLAGLFSAKLPDLFVSRMDGLPSDPGTPAAPVSLSTDDDTTARDGVTLAVDPEDALVDEPLRIRAESLAPGTKATVRTSTVDAGGHRWEASAVFTADDSGTVDTGAAAPISGDWSSADANAAVWAMRFASDGVVPDLFLPPPTPWAIAVEVDVQDGPLLTRTAVRRPTLAEVRVDDLAGDGFVARLWRPATDASTPGVVLFPGSEGGLDSQSATAALLAAHGYAAMVACVHGAPGLPDSLVEMPLEHFGAAVRLLGSQPGIDPGRVAAMSISKGSEGLLAAASLHASGELAGLVAVSPSAVMWQAIGDDGAVAGTGTWTFDGQALPFVPVHAEEMMGELLHNALTAKRLRRHHQPALMHLRAGYEVGLQTEADAISSASIAVEEIGAPVLFVGGSEDQVWPSGQMIETLVDRRGSAGVELGDDHQLYQGAGHLLRFGVLPTDVAWTGGIALGGHPEGTAAAQADFERRVLAFLATHLGIPPLLS